MTDVETTNGGAGVVVVNEGHPWYYYVVCLLVLGAVGTGVYLIWFRGGRDAKCLGTSPVVQPMDGSDGFRPSFWRIPPPPAGTSSPCASHAKELACISNVPDCYWDDKHTKCRPTATGGDPYACLTTPAPVRTDGVRAGTGTPAQAAEKARLDRVAKSTDTPLDVKEAVWEGWVQNAALTGLCATGYQSPDFWGQNYTNDASVQDTYKLQPACAAKKTAADCATKDDYAAALCAWDAAATPPACKPRAVRNLQDYVSTFKAVTAQCMKDPKCACTGAAADNRCGTLVAYPTCVDYACGSSCAIVNTYCLDDEEGKAYICREKDNPAKNCTGLCWQELSGSQEKAAGPA